MEIIRKLNTLEEEMILRALFNDENWDNDNGSSRVVFLSLGEETIEVLEKLGINTNCVIKINIGKSGCVQSKQERDIYIDAWENGHAGCFATIYAYGTSMQIMEKLDCRITYFFRDAYDCLYFDDGVGYHRTNEERFYDFAEEYAADIEHHGFNQEELEDFAYEFGDFLDTIAMYTGITGDNSQVGFDEHFNIKSYDYGYFSDSDNSECCFQNDPYDIAMNIDNYIGNILSLERITPENLEDIALEL